MKRYTYLICALFLATCLSSCGDDDPAVGYPVVDIKTNFEAALFGDSLSFTFHASDEEVPLSTLKAELYYGDELVSETVIRTRTNSDYTGKIYIPYFPNVANGTATLKFILQNINFTKSEKEYNLPLSRPDFPYLTLVTRENEYRMERTGLYEYAVTDAFPQNLSAYIKAPAVGPQGNEILFGWGDERSITENENGYIPFSGVGSEYTVTFNTLTYEASPFTSLSFNGEEMEMIDENTYQIEKTLSQGSIISITGIEGFDSWWINPDYFTRNSNGTLTLVPVDARYRITLDLATRYLKAEVLNGTEQASLNNQGHGALWLMGWGVGKPSLDYQFGWEPGFAYCVPEASSQVYRVVLVGGPENGSVFGQTIRVDYISCKFFHQNDWGGEINSAELTPGTEAYLIINGDGNLELAEGVTLEENATYILTVDLTNGNQNAVISFVKE